MVFPSLLQKGNTPWPNASDALWVVEESTSHPTFQSFQSILQDWLSSEKPQLEMKLEPSSLLWVPLACFLMHYSHSMAWTVTVSYSQTLRVVITLTR